MKAKPLAMALLTGLAVGLVILLVTSKAQPPGQIYLWQEGTQGIVGAAADERTTMDVYWHPSLKSKTAVIICPGGGYEFLALDHEGAQVARWLNERGVTAFVLHYRLPPKAHLHEIVADGQRAVRWVRAHAAEYELNPAQIGIWGFSAGGHLASTVATHFDSGAPASADAVERESDRPDFQILVYPVITMEAPLTHAGSRLNLLGENPSAELIAQYSNEQQVTAQTPPAFLLHSLEDPGVSAQNSVLYAQALAKAGVPVELHLFQRGQHGEGLAVGDPNLGGWPDLLERWLRLGGWLN